MPTQYWCALAHERFQPDDLLKQAREAEQAGFDGICCSDHLAPWWTDKTAPTASGNAWVWLGAASRETTRAALGPAVTAIVYRYNPVVVAQQVATLEILAPGRAFLGVGSGEALNEVPAGMRWRPPVYLSAFHDGAARLAGRLADGIWTLGDPKTAPKLIDAYKDACEQAGRPPGEIIVQGMFSYAATDEEALESAREWKGTLVDAHYTDDVHKPEQIYESGEKQVSDEMFAKQVIASADPEHHVDRIKSLEELGATVVALMSISGSDPHAALRVYGERVLPELRG
jgi:coenzyme F420-dependent glucose-6-phosphate dehydrogenase